MAIASTGESSKRRYIIGGVIASLLITGAIIAGIFGSRANGINNKQASSAKAQAVNAKVRRRSTVRVNRSKAREGSEKGLDSYIPSTKKKR